MLATEKSYELEAMEWFEVKDGLIHRRLGARDSASQGKQLGWTQGRAVAGRAVAGLELHSLDCRARGRGEWLCA
jgi:hypothetical protein